MEATEEAKARRREYVRKAMQKYRAGLSEASKEEYRKKSNVRTRAYMGRLRDEAYDMLGGKCARCGESDKIVLEIHHADEDGAEDGNAARTVRKRLLRVIEKKGEGYSLLCANCHKRVDYELRHKLPPA